MNFKKKRNEKKKKPLLKGLIKTSTARVKLSVLREWCKLWKEYLFNLTNLKVKIIIETWNLQINILPADKKKKI